MTSLLKSTSTTSSLNHLPILKQIINTVATPLHQIICGSLSSGAVPPDFKKAVITPIFKKLHLKSLSPSNYRPIFNLSIHSKILERIISSQLITYLTTNNIPNIFQSAYLPHKSTKSALTLIASDVLSGLNNNSSSILVFLLDLNVLIHKFPPLALLASPSIGSPLTFPIVLPLLLTLISPSLYHPWCSPGLYSWSYLFQHLPTPHVTTLYRLPIHFISYLRR